MVQYAGNPANYPTDFTITSDNTQRAAVTINVAMEALGDRTAWINARFVNGVDGGTYSGPLTFTNVQALSGPAGINITGDLQCDDISGDILTVNQVNTGMIQMPDGGVGIGHTFTPTSALIASDLRLRDPYRLTSETTRSFARALQLPMYANSSWWNVDSNGHMTNTAFNSPSIATCSLTGLRVGCTITSVKMWYKAGPGHASVPVSGLRWAVGCTRTHKTTGVVSPVFANTADPTTVPGTYESYHAITVTSITNPVYDPDTYFYRLYALAETDGALWKTGGVVYGFEVAGTYTVMGEY